MRDIIIYVALWSEKYLSKRSLIKHTCSWSDKLIVLWTLNTHAKNNWREKGKARNMAKFHFGASMDPFESNYNQSKFGNINIESV